MNNILANKELMVGLVNVKNPSELGKLFSENSIQLEDGLTFEQAFEIVKSQENGELNEASLDEVTGGIALTVALGAAAAFTVGAAAVSFIAGYAYRKYKK